MGIGGILWANVALVVVSEAYSRAKEAFTPRREVSHLAVVAGQCNSSNASSHFACIACMLEAEGWSRRVGTS